MEVKHTIKGTKNKDEAVKKYMDRLEKIHSMASNEHKKDLLKNYIMKNMNNI